MNRALLVLVLLIGFAGVTATALPTPEGPIRHVETIEGFGNNLTAGDTDQVTVAFENHVRQPLPVYTVLTAVSSEGINGGEFTLSTTLLSENTERSQTAELDCRYVGNRNPYEGVYLCSSNDTTVLPGTTQPSWNTLNTEIMTALNTAPGTYHFRMDVLSRIGLPARPPVREPAPKHADTRIVLDGITVTVNASQDATVTVEPYDTLVIPGPDGRKLVSGLGLDVGTETAAVPFDGTITFDYSAATEPSTLAIYQHDGTQWKRLDSTVHMKPRQITAPVNETGVYALFSTESAPGDTDDRKKRSPDRRDADDDEADASGPDHDGTTDAPADSDKRDLSRTSPAQACIGDDWSCSEWSACMDGTQYRSCEPSQSCFPNHEQRPIEERSCVDQTEHTPEDGEETALDETGETDPGNATVADSEEPEEHQEHGRLTGHIVSEYAQTAAITGFVVLLLVSLLLSRAGVIRKWTGELLTRCRRSG